MARESNRKTHKERSRWQPHHSHVQNFPLRGHFHSSTKQNVQMNRLLLGFLRVLARDKKPYKKTSQ